VELRQIAYFEAVVRCGGFTRAAEHLHVAQPAVSAQVRQLERELGAPLLLRTTRRVTLTAAGETFLGRARRILAEVEATRQDFAELADVLSGRVTVATTQLLGPLDLPGTLARFHRAYPGVDLALRSGLVAALLAALDDGDVDLVLGPLHPGLPDRFSAESLFDEELVVATPPGHRLASAPAVDVADLRDESFVSLAPGSGLRTLLEEAAAAAGFSPRVRFETHGPDSIRELVGVGLGVALMARSTTSGPGPAVAVVPLRDGPHHPPVGLIRLRDRALSPAASACRDYLRGDGP
jgi:DNA-binding transcriptional LysR family regulator